MHAIRWRPVDEIAIRLDLVNPEWGMQGQGIARATVVAVGRNDDDVRNFRQGICQRIDTPGEIAVVVTDKDFHKDLIGCSVPGALTILNVSPPP